MHDLPADAHPRLRALLETFLLENGKLNLSALRTEEAAWHGNILDSLPFLALIEQAVIPSPASLLDVGTGGGFPLLPLAVMLPETRCVGLDSIGKKMSAVRRIAEALGLSNVETIAERAEALGHDAAHRERYDAVTARAVAPLPTLLECTAPFARPDGCVVLWKSLHAEEEIAGSERAQAELRCRLEHRHVYDLGGTWGSRQLLVFRKHAGMPRIYPRAVGIPKKTPIT